jgi:hypothetical protein
MSSEASRVWRELALKRASDLPVKMFPTPER